MNIDFSFFSEVLSKFSDGPLPDEVVELSKFSTKSYGELFQSLSSEEQADLRSHFELAKKRVLQLGALTRGEESQSLYSLAVSNLLVIRDYYKKKSVPLRGFIQKIIVVARHLPEDVQKMLFIGVPPQYLENGSENLDLLVSQCQESTFAKKVELFLINVPEEALSTYVQNLVSVLLRCNPQEWRLIACILKGDKVALISFFAKLMKGITDIDPKQMPELAAIVAEYKDNPTAVEASLPLLSLCTTNSDVPDIVQVVAAIRDEDRKPIVQLVIHAVGQPQSASIVYRELVRNFLLACSITDDSFINYCLSAPTSDILPIIKKMPPVTPLELFLRREDVVLRPLEVLRAFVAVTEQKRSFFIAFAGEPAIGTPVTRDFIRELFSGICGVSPFIELKNGLFRPEKGSLSPEEEALLFNLGKLFMYSQKSIYFLGKQLDMSVFIALKLLSRKLLDMKVSHDTFDLFYPIYKEMRGLKDDPALDGEAKEALLESMKNAITPCMVIRRGMNIPARVTAEDLEISIQGNVTAQQILKQIEFGDDITEEFRVYFRSWIVELSKDPSKMKQFFMALTESPILGPRPINVTIRGRVLAISTITQTLYLPECKSTDQILLELDEALETGTYLTLL